MPYLHWETDRRRMKSAEILKRHSTNQWSPFVNVVESAQDPVKVTTMDRENSDRLLDNIATRMRTRRSSVNPRKITHQTFQKQTLLGRLLLLAANLYEAMDGYADEKLIEKYLNSRPALHPRRTLDQSYYWTLKDTCNRDRDQVVYRGTAPSQQLLHHRCEKQDSKKKNTQCRQCTENVKKVPRVVMVDQLWMWVLDESKFLTEDGTRLFYAPNVNSEIVVDLRANSFSQIQLSQASQRDGEGTNQTHPLFRSVSVQDCEPLVSTK